MHSPFVQVDTALISTVSHDHCFVRSVVRMQRLDRNLKRSFLINMEISPRTFIDCQSLFYYG